MAALSTPRHPQSNGHAEAAVEAMKFFVCKSTQRGHVDSEEFCQGLLKWQVISNILEYRLKVFLSSGLIKPILVHR